MNQFLGVIDEMTEGSFRLKSRELFERHGQGKTLYRVAEDGGANYTTLHRWVNSPERIRGVQLDVLFGFLTGLGFSLEQVNSLTLGEVFEFAPKDAEAAE